jgi:hypothetical protein
LSPVYGSSQSAQFGTLGVTVCAVKVCPDWSASGFTSQACCTSFCEATFTTCGVNIGLYMAGLSSIQKCNALKLLRSCYVNMTVAASSTCTTSVTGSSVANTYLNGILGVNTEYDVYATLTNVCPDINAGTVNSTGCNGWCDEKISDVIEVNRAWHTDGNASEQIYAMLIEIETFSNQAWHNFGEALQELKVQEQEAQAAYGNNYTQDIENPDIKFGDGRRALFQLTLDYGLQTYYGYEANSVRTSFSSPQWYHATSKNLFMTEGTDRNDLVYWLSGFNGQGASFGGTTEYNNPTGLAIDKAQRVHIADSNNYRILRM